MSWVSNISLVFSHLFPDLCDFGNIDIDVILYEFNQRVQLTWFFWFKKKSQKSLTSGVIYNFACADCSPCYMALTKRFWDKKSESTCIQDFFMTSGVWNSIASKVLTRSIQIFQGLLTDGAGVVWISISSLVLSILVRKEKIRNILKF